MVNNFRISISKIRVIEWIWFLIISWCKKNTYFVVISIYYPESFYFQDVSLLFFCLLFAFQILCPTFICFFQFYELISSKWKSGARITCETIKILYFCSRKINSCVPFGIFAKKKSIRNQNPCMFYWSILAVRCATICCRSTHSNVKWKSSFNHVNG